LKRCIEIDLTISKISGVKLQKYIFECVLFKSLELFRLKKDNKY